MDDWAKNKAVVDSNPHFWYQDPDGITRPGDSRLADITPITSGDGVMLFPSTIAPSSYPQRRPVILNRPFRSVGELGDVFRDQPFKTLDFWSGLSADSGLLDLFSVSDQPAFVAGTVNVNSAPAPVLRAILTGATKVESPTLVTSGSAEAQAVAQAITSSISTNGPLTNPAGLVTFGDNVYTALLASSGSSSNNKTFGETFVRALAPVANTRTWNLMIDVIAQTGTFSPGAPATGAALNSSFNVQGETHYWQHIAIDRYTGQVVDQSIEQIPTGPILNTCNIAENLASGATVGTFSASSPAGGILSYALVSGTGGDDNAAFSISGNTLVANSSFQYLNKSAYKILVSVTDQNGLTIQQPFTINVQPAPYTQWKITNFQSDAGNSTVAGDTASPSGDGIPNLVKYALGLNPLVRTNNGISESVSGNVMTMNYTLASGATDVTTHAYWSSDLKTWSATGVTETMLSGSSPVQLWKVTVPVTSQTPMFMRLQITKP